MCLVHEKPYTQFTVKKNILKMLTLWFELTLFIHFKEAIQKAIGPYNENRRTAWTDEV